MATFVIDCPFCKAKVAAEEEGRGQSFFVDDGGSPNGERILVGSCPRCKTLLVGQSEQIHFENYDAEEDQWSDVNRVFPKPAKTFSSYRIPKVALDSLGEADRTLQANASVAACVMFGRALEAVCRDVLEPKGEDGEAVEGAPKKWIMLAAGIRLLREKNFIDDRLYDWSQQLHAFRNLAAHPDEGSISRDDAEDLQAFVYAIIEYIYDLTDRYNQFKARLELRSKKKRK
jgi:hypothetical protein